MGQGLESDLIDMVISLKAIELSSLTDISILCPNPFDPFSTQTDRSTLYNAGIMLVILIGDH